MKLNLGCCDDILPGYVNVDIVPPCDQQVDLAGQWPWPDSSVDEIKAHDIFEHLPDVIHTLNETHRVLRPGGKVEIVVPTTDGRGAWQDPTHCSFFNRNTFYYFEVGNPHLTRFAPMNGVHSAFKILSSAERTYPDHVVKLRIVLEAVK